jgi:tetratricopeptide (TPR) repeat protein
MWRMHFFRASGRVALLAVVCLTTATARADGDRYEKARTLYGQGKSAYEAGHFQEAYESFKTAYLLSQEPALLYNIASALQGLDRPHDAAETLRSYLRARPNDPDRPAIEERITTLEEAQRVLDLDRKKEERATRPPPPVATPAVATATPPPKRVEPRRPVDVAGARTLRNAGIGVGVAGIAILVGGVVAGVLAKENSDEVTRESKAGSVFNPTLERNGRNDDIAAGVLCGVGVAAAVTGAALALVGWRRAHRVDVSAAVGTGRVGASLRLSF